MNLYGKQAICVRAIEILLYLSLRAPYLWNCWTNGHHNYTGLNLFFLAHQIRISVVFTQVR